MSDSIRPGSQSYIHCLRKSARISNEILINQTTVFHFYVRFSLFFLRKEIIFHLFIFVVVVNVDVPFLLVLLMDSYQLKHFNFWKRRTTGD